jgi:uncharacterized protein (TIGR00730 family)
LRGHPQRREIERTIVSLLEISRSSTDASEWRLIRGAMADIRDGLAVFGPRRQTRKVTVFGSARTATEDPAYKLAEQLAAEAVAQGFDVMTGAGGGIMEAANRGAGCENSIGLNVDLPFEQHANRYVSGCDGRLLHFRYFFTRKLFFLRESDALVVLPGGYGTFDELFESLTLIQTGRTPPIPLVMLAPPGDDFWPTLMRDVQAGLAARGLISAEDTALLKQATTAAEAMEHICTFYRVFHGAQLGEDLQDRYKGRVEPIQFNHSVQMDIGMNQCQPLVGHNHVYTNFCVVAGNRQLKADQDTGVQICILRVKGA